MVRLGAADRRGVLNVRLSPPIAAGYRDCGLPKLVPIARWVLGQRLVLPSKVENKNPGAACCGEVKEEPYAT